MTHERRSEIAETAQASLREHQTVKGYEQAIADSIDKPTPMPEMNETKDGAPILDPYGNKVFTAGYKIYLNHRPRPTDEQAFKMQLQAALTSVDGDPCFLLISPYTGNIWWGRAYTRFFSSLAASSDATLLPRVPLYRSELGPHEAGLRQLE